jgi:hypothetical protein
VAGALVTLITGYYLHRLFVVVEVEVLRTWEQNRPAGYWMPFDLPPEVAIFGFPHNSGWKTIGVQYADGEFDGNFLTNEKPEVVDWYTRGGGVCPRGDRYYIVASRTEPQADAAAQKLVADVANEFSLRQLVTVQGEAKLHLFAQAGADGAVQTLDAAAFERRFDAELSHPRFVERRGRVLNPAIQHRLAYRLGDAIELAGYDLATTEVAPGGELALTLYWQALRPLAQSFTVFNQVIDPVTTAKAGQLDGMPVCDRNPTNRWFAGDLIADRYTVPIAPDAAPGRYTLISGMYDAETGERLEIRDGSGSVIGTEAAIAEIQVR